MDWFDWAEEHLTRWKARKAASREFAIKTYTPRVRQALQLARKESDRLNHNYVGTDHLLGGLVALDRGVAAATLKTLG